MLYSRHLFCVIINVHGRTIIKDDARLFTEYLGYTASQNEKSTFKSVRSGRSDRIMFIVKNLIELFQRNVYRRKTHFFETIGLDVNNLDV